MNTSLIIENLKKQYSGNEVLKGISFQVKEALLLFAKWKKASIDWGLTERLGLKEIENKQYRQLSTGQTRRLHLVLSIIGNPDIIFLDEPTAGLDVEGRSELHKEIRAMKSQGKTIIMTSHDMAEVEGLSDRLAILKNGNIAFMGTSEELTGKEKENYKLHIKSKVPLSIFQLHHCSFKAEHQGYIIFETLNLQEGLLEILTLAKEKEIEIEDIKIEHLSLEEGFLNIAKEV